MKTRDLMSREVKSCGPDTNLAEAAKIMWDGDCGMVPVLDHAKKVIGILTDRDIAMALATRNRPASDLMVQEVASGTVHSCAPDGDIKKDRGSGLAMQHPHCGYGVGRWGEGILPGW